MMAKKTLTPEELIEQTQKAREELEGKTKLTFLERRHYKKQLKIQKKAIKKLRKEYEKEEREETQIRKIAIEALIEINGEAGNEGILDILDEDGKEMNRQKFEEKTTDWLLKTWDEALDEVAKIVGNKEYENKIDFKEGHGE